MFNKVIKTFAILFSLFFITTVFADDAVTSDANITSAVTSKITSDATLANTNIVVTTNNGVVNLQGAVDSDTQASNATELAQSVPGVQDVNTSDLTVKSSSQPFTDSFITAKVKGKFIQQKLFGDQDVAAMTITVETNDGVVSLSGTADNQDQINNAIQIAKTINGVKEVKSTVTIKS